MTYSIPYQVTKIDDLSDFGITNIVAAIGVFDGIHLGHRLLFLELKEMAEELDAEPIAITFHPHPRVVLNHDTNLRFLRSPEKKAKLMRMIGLKAIVTIPFSLEFANLSPNDFIESFLIPKKVNLKGICVGSKWRFGAKAQGNEQTLHNFADKYGFKFQGVNEVYWGQNIVSSTSIRKALSEGDFKTANFMLARNYLITGNIIEKIKRSNNFTYICEIKFGVIPPPGKYSVYINENKTDEHEIKILSESVIEINTPHNFKDDNIAIEFISSLK